MATAAVVALIMAVNPVLSPSQIEAILQTTAVDLGAAGWDPYFGFGRIDAAGAVAMAYDSSPADSQAPQVAINAPFNAEEVTGLVTVAAEATDNFGINRVELVVDGMLLASSTVAPYSFTWDASAHGKQQAELTARAIDEGGNVGLSAPVVVKIAQNGHEEPPRVELLNPRDGEVVSGNVSLSASATDNVAVAQLVINVNGKVVCSGTATASCSWNTRKVSAGSSHTIAAAATDSSGNVAQMSARVTIAGGSTDSTATTETSSGGPGKKKR